MPKRLSKGLRKFVRIEKSRIKREVSSAEAKKKQIEELYSRIQRE